MRENNSLIDRLFSKHLAGELTKEESEELDKLLSVQPDLQERLNLLENIWNTDVQYPQLINAADQRHAIWKRLSNNAGNVNRKKHRSMVVHFMKYAAILILVAGIGYVFWINSFPSKEPTITESKTVERINPLGQKSRLQLPDGTMVWLNADSRLTYDEGYNQFSRTVYLEGEAFFEVFKDPSRPFQVMTDELKVTALGTSFNVKVFDNDKKMVALNTGSVKVECTAEEPKCAPSILQPGDLARLESGYIRISSYEDTDPFGWKEGRIVFNHATFDEVIAVLTRWYDVKIELQGQLPQQWDYSSTFDNEILENVLMSLKFSENIEYQIIGTNVIIKI